MDEYLLTEEEIDTIRQTTETECGEDVSRTWWDWCAAYEKMHGEEATQGAEQLMIDYIIKVSHNACRAQLAKLKAPDYVEGIIAGIIGEYCDCHGDEEPPSCIPLITQNIIKLYNSYIFAAEEKGRQEERQAIIEKLNYLSETYSLYIPEIRIHELRQSLGGA